MINGKAATVSISLRLFAFALLVSCSLVLTAAVNHTAGTALNLYAPKMAWIATAAIPSAVFIMMLYAFLGKRSTLVWPILTPLLKRRVFAISTIWLLVWLVGFAIASFLSGHRLNYAEGLPLITAFIVFGPIGEELLFRGLVFEKAREIWPTTAVPAMCISTIAFSLHHIALAAAPQGIAIGQLLFTIPMGFIFAHLREKTGSLLPGWLLHVVTNLPAIL